MLWQSDARDVEDLVETAGTGALIAAGGQLEAISEAVADANKAAPQAELALQPLAPKPGHRSQKLGWYRPGDRLPQGFEF